MTLNQFRYSISAIADLTENAGHGLHVFTRGGHSVRGDYYMGKELEDGLLMMDPYKPGTFERDTAEPTAFIAVSDIVAVKLVNLG